MERVKVTYNPCDECRYSYSKQNQESYQCKVCEFKTYVDAERQGLIIVLPCKVGTKIYYIGSEINDEINEWEYFVSEYGFKPYMLEELGKRYFLTKEEAEQALAKMKEV